MIFVVLCGGEWFKLFFWLFLVLGVFFVVGYVVFGEMSIVWKGDLYMLVVIILCGLGYVEGVKFL